MDVIQQYNHFYNVYLHEAYLLGKAFRLCVHVTLLFLEIGWGGVSAATLLHS